MTRDTTHGTKGSSIVRAFIAAVLVASLFGVSALTASAQEDGSWLEPGDFPGFDNGEFEAPTPLEACETVLPDGVDVSGIVADVLAETDLPQEVIDEIVDLSAAGDVTCDDIFAEAS